MDMCCVGAIRINDPEKFLECIDSHLQLGVYIGWVGSNISDFWLFLDFFSLEILGLASFSEFFDKVFITLHN